MSSTAVESMPAARIRQRVRQRWALGQEQAVALLRTHGIALVIVLVACVLAQAATLKQLPLIKVDPDGITYMYPAQHLSDLFFDARRTPGYPAFLALILGAGKLITGRESLGLVTLVQAALTVAAAFELYALIYVFSRSKLAACIAAALVGVNIYIANWERLVRVESPAFFIAVTLLLLVAWYLRTERRAALVSLSVVSVIAIMVRPSFLIFPAIIFAFLALYRWRRDGLRALRGRWKEWTAATALIYLVLVAYSAGNAAATGFFGLTDVTNMNSFGKVLEYHMQNENTDPAYAQVRADANAYVAQATAEHAANFPEPYHLVEKGPMTYVDPHYNLLGHYAKEVISQHPIEFAVKSVPDVIAAWLSPPTLYYVPYNYGTWWILPLQKLSKLEFGALFLLPILLLLLGYAAWRHPEHELTVILFLALVLVAAGIVLIGTGSYGEFYRLRSPMDFAVIVAALIVLLDLGSRLVGRKLELVRW